MPDESLHQPHDKLFKTTFGDPVNAAAFLREQLPPHISAAIHWGELRLESGSFLDSQFRASESDLLLDHPARPADLRNGASLHLVADRN